MLSGQISLPDPPNEANSFAPILLPTLLYPACPELRGEPRRVLSEKSQGLCNKENPVSPPWRDSCLPRASRGLLSLPRASKGAHFAKGCENTETASLTTFRINTLNTR